jgi:hypothetical protein
MMLLLDQIEDFDHLARLQRCDRMLRAGAHGARRARGESWSFAAFAEVKWVSQRWSSDSLPIAAGALGLAYGSFTYTKETNSANPIVPGVLLVAFRST